MCKSQNYDQSKNHKEVSNTNLGLLNMSSESTIGWAEVLEILSFIIMILLAIKWCCKKRKRSNDKAARRLEEMIRTSQPRVGTPAMPTSMPTAPTMSAMPAVTFQQPGSRVVFMKEGPHINELPDTGKTEWDKFR